MEPLVPDGEGFTQRKSMPDGDSRCATDRESWVAALHFRPAQSQNDRPDANHIRACWIISSIVRDSCPPVAMFLNASLPVATSSVPITITNGMRLRSA